MRYDKEMDPDPRMCTDRVTGQYVPLELTAKCAALDRGALASEIYPDASPLFHAHLSALSVLIFALLAHPGIQNNKPLLENDGKQAPPKEAQNTVYFMWDFCSRTRNMLMSKVNQKDPEKDLNNPPEGEDMAPFAEVIGRNVYSAGLITKDRQMLAMMNGEKPGEEIDFGDEVRKCADLEKLVPGESKSQST
ncbi:MAG: hypothetical protein M1831_002355 [Alyxoria varia]|nr:MAG: hypothetical protein M1831_002355 [Alyxoria varia]